MRKYLTILFICISAFSFADAWDDLSYEDAQIVVDHLKKHPFILDYCDCCDHEGEYAAEVFLMKVLSTEIVECSWNEGMYSVKANVVALAQIPNKAYGIDIKNLIKCNKRSEETIYMNYTWVFDEVNKRAAPFFNIFEYQEYGDAEPCKNYTSFPNPFNTDCVIFDISYKKWYWMSFIKND